MKPFTVGRVSDSAMTLRCFSGDGGRDPHHCPGRRPEFAELPSDQQTPQNGVYALLDVGPHLDDPVRLRTVKRIAQEQYRTERTLVMVGHGLELPRDLKRLSASFDLAVPSARDLRVMMKEELQLYTRDTGEKSRGSAEAAELMIQHLVGPGAVDIDDRPVGPVLVVVKPSHFEHPGFRSDCILCQ